VSKIYLTFSVYFTVTPLEEALAYTRNGGTTKGLEPQGVLTFFNNEIIYLIYLLITFQL